MRRFVAMVFAIIFFFSGCTGEKNHLTPAIDFRAKLVQSGGCHFVCNVIADYGNEIQQFRLSCDADEQGTVSFTILEPEILAGISAKITDGGKHLDYEGLMVDLGLLADGNLPPASAPGWIVNSWLSGYILWAGNEGELYRVTCEQQMNDSLFQIETFYKKMLPIYAEICYNNQRVLRMEIEEFQYH